MILKTSKHHIAAAPLAQMESLQSLLPAVLPCKHQRCVVLGRRKCGTKLSRWCKFHTSSHGGLFVFSFEVSTSTQRCEDPFPERQTSLTAPGSEMRHIKQMSVTFRTSLKLWHRASKHPCFFWLELAHNMLPWSILDGGQKDIISLSF